MTAMERACASWQRKHERAVATNAHDLAIARANLRWWAEKVRVLEHDQRYLARCAPLDFAGPPMSGAAIRAVLDGWTDAWVAERLA